MANGVGVVQPANCRVEAPRSSKDPRAIKTSTTNDHVDLVAKINRWCPVGGLDPPSLSKRSGCKSGQSKQKVVMIGCNPAG